jgi:hypothetical protein
VGWRDPSSSLDSCPGKGTNVERWGRSGSRVISSPAWADGGDMSDVHIWRYSGLSSLKGIPVGSP